MPQPFSRLNQRIRLREPGNQSIRLHCRHTSPRDRPVLFLHGLAGSGDAFADAPERIDTSTFQLLIPDLPGHGRSGARDAYPYTPSWYRKVVQELLNELNVTPEAVVGHSMGGTIGLFLVEKLDHSPLFINVEGLPESLEFLSRRVERYGEGNREEGFQKVRTELEHAADPGIQAWLRWAESTDPDAFFESAASFSEGWDGPKMIRRYQDYPVEKRFYICGAAGQAAFIRSLLSDDEFAVITGAGHFPMVNNPDEFWRAVRRTFDERLP